MTPEISSKTAILGFVGIVVSVAVLAVNPFQPLIRSTPEPLVSPVINYVHVALYAADGETTVDASWDARIAEMGVSLNNQVGANDCLYWTGDHTDGYGTKHTSVGIFDYWNPGFVWYNWGSGYDDFIIEVVRLPNRSGFVSGSGEDAEILFSGGDVNALVTPSDGSPSYTVPVYYNTYVWLGGYQPFN